MKKRRKMIFTCCSLKRRRRVWQVISKKAYYRPRELAEPAKHWRIFIICSGCLGWRRCMRLPRRRFVTFATPKEAVEEGIQQRTGLKIDVISGEAGGPARLLWSAGFLASKAGRAVRHRWWKHRIGGLFSWGDFKRPEFGHWFTELVSGECFWNMAQRFRDQDDYRANIQNIGASKFAGKKCKISLWRRWNRPGSFENCQRLSSIAG